MDVSVYHLDAVIERLSAQTHQPKTHKGFKEMAAIVGVSENYIYKNIFRAANQARRSKAGTVTLQDANLDMIAKHLGFSSFASFIKDVDKPMDSVLAGMEGNYYCYVRRNSKETVVMRSPVCIIRKSTDMLWELAGPLQQYRGVVRLHNGCLFVLMESANGKVIHHIYKIGARQKPAVLQGVFSGVSTVFDPIGGRVVLVRVEEPWEELTTKELTPADLSKSTFPWEQSLVQYFGTYHNNNLLTNKSTTFTHADLY